MVRSNILKAVLSFVVCASVFLPAPFTVAQDARPRRAQESTDATGTADAVLWREPTDVASRDLFLGPGGTGKSHLAQAIGQAAILQGHKVLYRQTHILLEEVGEATLEGRRKQYMESISSVASKTSWPSIRESTTWLRRTDSSKSSRCLPLEKRSRRHCRDE